MIPDLSKMKLGKSAPKIDDRTLQFAKYVTADLPAAPKSYGYALKLKNWGMMGNDTIGDCTCAAAGHLEMEFTDDNGDLVTPTTEAIIAAYSAITGYNPATGANDNGAECLTVLNYWRSKGIAGHTIQAFTAIDKGNDIQIKQATWLFGGVYIGIALPISAQTQKTWTVPNGGAIGNGAPGSWGGHCVPIIHYTSKYLYFVTWGQIMKMTWEFWATYCDEAYSVISPDFFTGDKAPNGFDLVTLEADLKLITG